MTLGIWNVKGYIPKEGNLFLSILQVFWIKIHSLHLCKLGVCLKLYALFGEKVNSQMKECRLWLNKRVGKGEYTNKSKTIY